MCKAWPGLRCTDHPYQKIQKYAAQVHKAEDEIATIDESLHTLTQEHGENVKDRPEYTVLTSRKTTLLEKISETSTKLNVETCHYAMSAGGRAKLDEIAQNSVNPTEVRLNAAAQLQSAKNRISQQKEISQIVNNDDFTPEEKDAYLELKQRLQQTQIKALYKEKTVIANRIKQVDEVLSQLTPEKNPRRYASAQKQRAVMVTQYNYIEEEIKQKEALDKEIARYRDQLQKQIQSRLNKISDRVFNVANFLLNPSGKSFFTDPWAAISRRSRR